MSREEALNLFDEMADGLKARREELEEYFEEYGLEEYDGDEDSAAIGTLDELKFCLQGSIRWLDEIRSLSS